MSNSTSQFSLSKNSGSNQSDPQNKKNKRLQKSKSVRQDSRVNLHESTLSDHDIKNNLNSLLSSLTPLVAVKFSSQPKVEGSSTESEGKPYFVLEDLWESYNEWSAFGVEVPLVLNNHEIVTQYFVPFLSGLQLYVEDDQGLEKSGFAPSNETTKLVFEYFEIVRPWLRMPLINKVSELAVEEHPGIQNYRSCDISPCSWFSVAWYPIYGIPAGSTLENFNIAFLTFHNLSTRSECKNQPNLQGEPLKMPVPIFGLTTFNLKESILTLPEALESDEMNSLLKAADIWLKSLKVEIHHDHNYFVKDGKLWIGK